MDDLNVFDSFVLEKNNSKIDFEKVNSDEIIETYNKKLSKKEQQSLNSKLSTILDIMDNFYSPKGLKKRYKQFRKIVWERKNLTLGEIEKEICEYKKLREIINTKSMNNHIDIIIPLLKRLSISYNDKNKDDTIKKETNEGLMYDIEIEISELYVKVGGDKIYKLRANIEGNSEELTIKYINGLKDYKNPIGMNENIDRLVKLLKKRFLT